MLDRAATIVLRRDAHDVTVDGEPVELTAKEFDLLACLLEHPGIVLSRERLLDLVWGMSYPGGTRTVDVHVAQLRRKLGRPDAIRTVRGAGYKLLVRREPGRAVLRARLFAAIAVIVALAVARHARRSGSSSPAAPSSARRSRTSRHQAALIAGEERSALSPLTHLADARSRYLGEQHERYLLDAVAVLPAARAARPRARRPRHRHA